MALLLVRRGITRVRPLQGGLQGWRDRGLPVAEALRSRSGVTGA